MRRNIWNNQRKMEKYRIRYRKLREEHHLLRQHATDILMSDNFQSTRKYIQHGNIPVYRHCMDVARHSLKISRKFGIKCNERELVRGALLHDYFLYDWHDRNRENYQFLHGFYHPGIALKNAKVDYQLTSREQDIIKKHMWPLTVVPPTCREAWIVSMADKYCSLLETLRIRRAAVKVPIQSKANHE